MIARNFKFSFPKLFVCVYESDNNYILASNDWVSVANSPRLLGKMGH